MKLIHAALAASLVMSLAACNQNSGDQTPPGDMPPPATTAPAMPPETAPEPSPAMTAPMPSDAMPAPATTAPATSGTSGSGDYM